MSDADPFTSRLTPSGPLTPEWASSYHAPVMVQEVVALLADAHHVLDGTLGGGGHTEALLHAGARVTAVDRDPDAIAAAGQRLAPFVRDGRLRLELGNYATLDDAALGHERYDGILLDLGVSSHQIDATARGFSFREGAPLDMRMGPDATRTAADFLNAADEGELAWVFREYGDERRAIRLAREVSKRRATRPFATSDDFVGAIRATLGPRSGPAEFARLFQAVRIAINEELGGLERALPTLRDRLESQGVFVVISYHSGEDRIVKRTFRDWSTACTCPPRQPVCTCGGRALGALVTKRGLRAGPAELDANPRSRSARLRAWRAA
ncbi:MAG TPA: 16S rRNA (cytosine(1402)-N(4))-methyltransferase RsmH [Gemmatimonadaceae bacterium]|nr:16S rRNA (cytosine(1402)-N(4))-methyltransferase RsmH [Gemmatimonadaceae bacterium]